MCSLEAPRDPGDHLKVLGRQEADSFLLWPHSQFHRTQQDRVSLCPQRRAVLAEPGMGWVNSGQECPQGAPAVLAGGLCCPQSEGQ